MYVENILSTAQQVIVIMASIALLGFLKNWMNCPLNGDEERLDTIRRIRALRRRAQKRWSEALMKADFTANPPLASSLSNVSAKAKEQELILGENRLHVWVTQTCTVGNWEKPAVAKQGEVGKKEPTKGSLGGESMLTEELFGTRVHRWNDRSWSISGSFIAIVLLGLTMSVFVAGCNFSGEPTPIPITPEPTQSPQPAFGSIGGVVWHDLCSNFDSESSLPTGCVVASDAGGYLANGVLEEGEPGIEAVQVLLGEGVCPSTGLATSTTGPDGSFTFSGLLPGAYCVTAENSNLQPGLWTYPEASGAGSMTVTLGIEQVEGNVNFGWDYMLLPATATPEPEDTPVPTPSCTDRASFVKDVTIPDGTYLKPGKEFKKVWRLKNTGTCKWTADYSLVFVSGYSLGGASSVPLLGAVPAGSVVDFTVDLEAPKVNGSYKGYWMLRNPQGALFGIGELANKPFWVQINIGPEPTPEITDWRGEYYDNRELKGDPTLVRNDKQIDFNWKKDSPAEKIPVDNFSVRWTRRVKFDAATYRFSVRVDDGVRLMVDDRVVINEWKDGADRIFTVDLAMSKGKHDLKLEYYERNGQARMHFSWEKLIDPVYADWRGAYWFNRSLDSDWALVRNDQEINFDWGEGSPAQAIPSNDFSARWLRLVAFEPGVYRFYAWSDDGIRAYLDDDLFMNEWHVSGGTEVYTKDLTLSGSHWLKVEYYEKQGRAKLKFWWEKVGSLNDPPVAQDDAYVVGEDIVLTVAAPGVLVNDIDKNGDALTAVLESGPSSGVLTLNGDGSFMYTPKPDFCGTDSFTYKVSDGSALSNGATVTITVNPMDDQPEAVDDSVTTQQETLIDIEVLSNDLGLGDTPISLSLASLPEKGEAEVVGNKIRYRPGVSFSGVESFEYTVMDADGDSSTATVTVTVSPLNNPPVVSDDAYSMDEDGALNMGAPGVLKNDSDPDGDSMAAVLEGDVNHGVLFLNPDGSFTYTPTSDFNGTDSFTYKVNDGSAFSTTVAVMITVKPLNDVPAAEDDQITIENGLPIDIAVLGNDSGLGDGPVALMITSQPKYGTVEIVDNQIRYTPGENFEGGDSFIYRVMDVDGESSSATVTVLSIGFE